MFKSDLSRFVFLVLFVYFAVAVRSSDVIWRKNINVDDHSITIEVTNDTEVADVIFHSLAPYNVSRENRQKVMDAAIQDGVPRSRDHALVFFKNIDLNDNGTLFSLQIFDDGTEPVDTIFNLLQKHKAENHFHLVASHVLPTVCKLVTCGRERPIIYTSLPVQVSNDTLLDGISILLGEEPVDSIDRFIIHYGLSNEIKYQLIQSICQEVTCTRSTPVVFRTNVDDGNGGQLGTVEFLEGEEVVDGVVRFLRKSNIQVDEIGFKNYFFKIACSNIRLKCTRNVSHLFDGDVHRSEDGLNLGRLIVTEFDQVADKVYTFCLERECGEGYMWGLIDTLCNMDLIRCSRKIPVIFSIPMNDPDGQFIGQFEVQLHEEPADAMYKFFALHDLFEKKWDFESVLDQICSEKFELHCQRRKGVKFYQENFIMGDTNVGTLLVWDHEEVVDRLFEKRIAYNLTLLDQVKAFSNICTQKEIYCSRSYAIVYELKDITIRDFERFGNETCDRKLFGWQFLTSTSDSWFGTQAIKVIQNEQVANFLEHPSIRTVLVVFGICCTLLLLRFIPQFRERTHFGHSLVLSFTILVLVSLFHVEVIEPNSQIDQAMHMFEGKLPNLVIYENEEPVDAVLRWGKLASKDHHPIVREKIYWDVLGRVCDEIKHKACTRKRAWEYIDAGAITVNGQVYKIDYYNPQVDPEGSLRCMRGNSGEPNSCIIKNAEQLCFLIYPPVIDCVNKISKHIQAEVKGHDSRRLSSKDTYTKLVLEMDAPQRELWLALARVVRSRGMNMVPYKRVDNGTAVYGPNDVPTQEAYKAMDAYIKVKDKESREWNDKPCTPYFGGALCGKTDKDGNMLIEV
jgi:hypothetical protein